MAITLVVVIGCRSETVLAVGESQSDSAVVAAQPAVAQQPAPDWCSIAPSVEMWLTLEWVDSATPVELESTLPIVVDELKVSMAQAPAEIEADLGTIVRAVDGLARALETASWDRDRVVMNEQLDLDLAQSSRARTRIAEYDADMCGIVNGFGTSVRAGELDEVRAQSMEPGERQEIEDSLVATGFSADEAECLVDAIASLTEMTSLLDAYGLCGIPLHRLIETATGSSSSP